jgi:membrane-bound lytic murein transglycosylase B
MASKTASDRALRMGLVISALLSLLGSLNGCSNASAQNAEAESAASSATASESPAMPAESFDEFLTGVRAEAREKGISAATLDAAFTGVKAIDRVVELDRKQPEFTLTFEQYVARVVNGDRVALARTRYKENQALLDAVGAKYGVQPRFIVALWGIETNFGQSTGGFSVVASLATLAYEGRRAAYFRGELMNALQIIDQGHIKAPDMKGSWAGAMGQSQFMPSTFLSYAVDWDGDGKRDIWRDKGDVFASAANYLKQSGWNDTETWGRRVKLPAGFESKIDGLKRPQGESRCGALNRLTVDKPLSEWQAMGIRLPDGGSLPSRDVQAALALPEGASGPALLVYGNFRATLRWNCSISFATAVGSLADQIAAR